MKVLDKRTHREMVRVHFFKCLSYIKQCVKQEVRKIYQMNPAHSIDIRLQAGSHYGVKMISPISSHYLFLPTNKQVYPEDIITLEVWSLTQVEEYCVACLTYERSRYEINRVTTTA